jgi:endonuclease/exonuclease/phosphatase family metal-dependent hydrolase
VILSRYPFKESGWIQYPIRQSSFRRGHAWAIIPTAAGDLLFVSVHLTPYEGFVADRAGQVADLLAFWNRRPRSIIVGDFNVGPDEAPIQRVVTGGLVDLPARHGLGNAFTFPALEARKRIDYIFASPDVESLAAGVPQTAASDHLPVEARIRLR